MLLLVSHLILVSMMLALLCKAEVRVGWAVERESKIRACTLIPGGLQIEMPAPTHKIIIHNLADEARSLARSLAPQQIVVAFIGLISKIPNSVKIR